MRVLITGNSGFVGGHLGRQLAAAGARVFGLSSDTQTGGAKPGGAEPRGGEIETFRADLLEPEALAQVVASCDPDVVVHLAGLSHVGESWQRPGDYFRINFAGTVNLLQAIGDRRLLFASSGEVYGSVPEDEQPIGEERPLEPRSPYAMTKACAERITRDHGAVVVRSFNVVGPGQSRRFALPSFAHQLARIARDRPDDAVLRVGDLTPRRDFLHIADAVLGYTTLIEHGRPGQAYNLAAGQAVSIDEALRKLKAISGVEAEIEPDPKRIRPVDTPVVIGDNQRLRALGWTPQLTLDDALRDLWQATSDGLPG